MPAAFLMQQMTWREALDDARDAAAVEGLDDQIAAQEQALLAEVSRLLDEQNDAVAAAQQVRSLMFVKRFRADIGRRLEAYET